MKKLGTDISLDVCKAEGYMMMEFDARKKFDRSTEYRVFNYYPEYCGESAGNINADVFISFDDLVEVYNESKQGLDSFAETNIHVDFNNPDYWDFLNLASDIESYQGL